MKRVMVMSFSFLLGLSVMAFAQPDKKEMEKMKKEQQEMTQLVEKYNKTTSDKKKDEIKAKIQAKVAANYEKHIERMEERLKDSQKKLDEAKAKLAESKTPEYKAKHVEEITQDILSGKNKPMFGMPPAGFDKGSKGHKGPFMKGENKECPFAKSQGKEDKECPCMKGHKDGQKGPKFGKGPVAELPVIKEKPVEK